MIDVRRVGGPSVFVKAFDPFFLEKQRIGDLGSNERARALAHRNRHAQLGDIVVRVVVPARVVDQCRISAEAHVGND